LRPGTLPHHRTCGLLASGGWNLQSASVPGSQSKGPRTLRQLDRLPRWAVVSQAGRATAVVTSRCFVRFHGLRSRVQVGSVDSFGPSLGTPFSSCVLQTLLRPLLTAPGLSAGGSPRVRVCSFRSRLWALQSAVSDCRASRVLACSPPTPCLTAHLCSFGRTFAFHPFAPAPCGDDLAVRLRLASLPPSGTFHPDRPDPCWAHERGLQSATMSRSAKSGDLYRNPLDH
jgi:hypothetical protein